MSDASSKDDKSRVTTSAGKHTISLLLTWFSREHWQERLISFNASWFVASMGTGAMAQVMTNFPYPATWLDKIGYCFWVLTIALFMFFSLLFTIRMFLYPALSRSIFQDFYQTSYLGAIPVTVDTIAAGIDIFYGQHTRGAFAAWALYWVAVAMSVFVGGVIVFITCSVQEAPELSSVTGVWLLSFIPCIVTSGTGANIALSLPLSYVASTILVSFLLWSLGVTMSLVIMTIYFWRLVRIKLPVRDAIVSCFIPMGPTGMGAYAAQDLAVAFSTYLRADEFTLKRDPAQFPDAFGKSTYHTAVAISVHWVGIFVALLLISFSTFWLLQSILAVAFRVPKRFNVGFWAFVFPNAVYTNGLCRMALDLDNRGFKGYAAAMCVLTALLWLLCALMTCWRGVWKGELFFAPGLEGWNERKALGWDDAMSKKQQSKSIPDWEFEGGVQDDLHQLQEDRNHLAEGENEKHDGVSRADYASHLPPLRTEQMEDFVASLSRPTARSPSTRRPSISSSNASAQMPSSPRTGSSSNIDVQVRRDSFTAQDDSFISRTSRPDGSYSVTRWRRTREGSV